MLFIFYSIWRICIWLPTIQIYFMRLTIQQINTIRDKIPTFHWCFQPNWISRKKWLKMFFDNLICFILNHDFYVIILYDSFLCYHSLCITCSSSLEQIKLIGIVNWIFHVPDFLSLFMMSFKHGLVSWKCFLIYKTLFLSSLLSYLI